MGSNPRAALAGSRRQLGRPERSETLREVAMMGAECEVASEKTKMNAQKKSWRRRGGGQWRRK